MAIYRPRMHAVLEVPVGDESVSMAVKVRSATLESNSHLHADELQLEAEWGDAASDPRFLRDANVAFWIGNADDLGNYTPRPEDARFIGIAHTVERNASETGLTVSLKCQDYTALFLSHKPVRAGGVPRYTDTLRDAWHRLCDETGPFVFSRETIVSTVAKLKDRIVFRGGVDPETKISKAVAARIAGVGGPISVEPAADAWGVWLKCIGMLGLISFIEGDHCVVTTTKDHFADDRSRTPLLMWGKNISSFRESAQGAMQAKGVAISSFDPTTGTTIEAFYPPRDDDRIQRRRLAAKKKGATGASLVKAADYVWQSYFGVTDPDALYAIAKAHYDVHARQELEGTLSTSEMRVETVGGDEVDLLSLRSGDSFSVQIDRDVSSGVFAALPEGERVQYLVDRGYTESVATVLAKTAADKMRFGFAFKVKKVRTHLEANGDSGKFALDIDYWNRIEIEDVIGK